jgi:hypothetical protein
MIAVGRLPSVIPAALAAPANGDGSGGYDVVFTYKSGGEPGHHTFANKKDAEAFAAEYRKGVWSIADGTLTSITVVPLSKDGGSPAAAATAKADPKPPAKDPGRLAKAYNPPAGLPDTPGRFTYNPPASLPKTADPVKGASGAAPAAPPGASGGRPGASGAGGLNPDVAKAIADRRAEMLRKIDSLLGGSPAASSRSKAPSAPGEAALGEGKALWKGERVGEAAKLLGGFFEGVEAFEKKGLFDKSVARAGAVEKASRAARLAGEVEGWMLQHAGGVAKAFSGAEIAHNILSDEKGRYYWKTAVELSKVGLALALLPEEAAVGVGAGAFIAATAAKEAAGAVVDGVAEWADKAGIADRVNANLQNSPGSLLRMIRGK